MGIKNICFSEGFDDYSTARVTLEIVAGAPVATVHTAAAEVGQGLVTLHQQIARTELGVTTVIVRPADTSVGSAGSSSASRQSYMSGGAVKVAWSLAADAVVVLHLLFIALAVFGGIGVLWVPQLAWLHLPALAWAVWISATHGVCPLTPLENSLRRLAGQAGYPESFIDHYLMPVIYPGGLTPAQLSTAILRQVLANVVSAAASAAGQIGGSAGGLTKDALGDAAQKAGEGIRKLFSNEKK